MATVAVGVFESTIDEDGKTRLPDRYVISAPLAGRLSRITLRAGDEVAVGAVVATLAPVLPPMLDERSAREAQARVEAAQALLQRAVVRVERARVAVEQVRIELRRSEQLAKDGFIAPTKLDADRLAMLAASKEVEASQQERHVAEHDLEQARAAQGAMRAASAKPGMEEAARSTSAIIAARPGPSSIRWKGAGLPIAIHSCAAQRPMSSPNTCEVSGAVVKSTSTSGVK